MLIHICPTNYGLYFLIQAVFKIFGIAVISLPMYLLIERPCMDPRWPVKLLAFFKEPADVLTYE